MMRILTKAAPFAVIALMVAGSALAGGAFCGGKEPAATKSASSGGHCDGVNNSASMAKACGVKSNQAMYSFAVPSAECDHCVKSIQSALMAQKGIHCAHVDLASRTAFVIADKSVNKKAVAKTIATAGFKNNFKGQGSKVEAEFAKAMASDKGSVSCSRKEKDKV